MNKHFVSIFVFIIATSFILLSCDNKMKSSYEISFDSIRINRMEHLFGDSAQPACNLIVNIAYPTTSNNQILKDSLTKFILTLCLGEEYSKLPPQAAVKTYSDNYVSDYRKNLEPNFKKEMEPAVHEWYNFYRAIHGKVCYFKGNLLSYRMDYNSYVGGAHNVYASNMENYDLGKMKRIGLADLFKPNFQNELSSILLKQLMDDLKLTTKDELQEKGYDTSDNFSPTENFLLDKKGITFYYNVGEIAPFVTGLVSIKVSYSQLENIINTAELQSVGLQ